MHGFLDLPIVQDLLGADDVLRHRERKERLPTRPESILEQKRHGAPSHPFPAQATGEA